MTAVIVVWWLVLLVALLLTLLAVVQILRIVQEAREIRRLARETVPAAQAIAANTACIGALAGLLPPAGRLVVASQAINRVAASIEGHVAGVVRALGALAAPSAKKGI